MSGGRNSGRWAVVSAVIGACLVFAGCSRADAPTGVDAERLTALDGLALVPGERTVIAAERGAGTTGYRATRAQLTVRQETDVADVWELSREVASELRADEWRVVAAECAVDAGDQPVVLETSSTFVRDLEDVVVAATVSVGEWGYMVHAYVPFHDEPADQWDAEELADTCLDGAAPPQQDASAEQPLEAHVDHLVP